MLHLKDLLGHSRVKMQLHKLLTHHHHHALLFEGPEGVGKGIFARTFARLLLQSDKEEPLDLQETLPQGKSHIHPMQTIREFIQVAKQLPFEAPHKVFLIHDADRMLAVSMHALLKTLEEPISNSIFLLITSRPQSLLPTLVSRCFRIPFFPLKTEEIESYLLSQGRGAQESRRVALLSHGSVEKAITLSSAHDNLAALTFDLGPRLLHRDYSLLLEYKDLQNSEETLSYLFYFYRDLNLLKVGADPSLLFYKDKEKPLREYLSLPIPSLEELQEKFYRIHQSLTLHIPLSHALCELL